MNSCISALECSKIIKKREVIIPSWTCPTANAVINSGCKPVFADVELNSRNISPAEIEKLQKNYSCNSGSLWWNAL